MSIHKSTQPSAVKLSYGKQGPVSAVHIILAYERWELSSCFNEHTAQQIASSISSGPRGGPPTPSMSFIHRKYSANQTKNRHDKDDDNDDNNNDDNDNDNDDDDDDDDNDDYDYDNVIPP